MSPEAIDAPEPLPAARASLGASCVGCQPDRRRGHVVVTGPTEQHELSAVLVELVDRSRAVLRQGRHLGGRLLVGSFAVGDADAQSDCDSSS